MWKYSEVSPQLPPGSLPRPRNPLWDPTGGSGVGAFERLLSRYPLIPPEVKSLSRQGMSFSFGGNPLSGSECLLDLSNTLSFSFEINEPIARLYSPLRSFLFDSTKGKASRALSIQSSIISLPHLPLSLDEKVFGNLNYVQCSFIWAHTAGHETIRKTNSKFKY